jgi:hypothetical protein
MALPRHLVIGPIEHGVNAYALQAARALGAPVLRVDRWEDVPSALGETHLHVTDQLIGRPADLAAERIEDLARRAESLSVTLHDVPQPSDGPRNCPRRAAAYRRIVEAAHLTIVNSHHEASLLREAGIIPAASASAARALGVVPLPLPEMLAAVRRPPQGQRPTLGVFGYVYPGKGYEEAIEAASATNARVLALGRVAAGHDGLADELRERAEQLGVELSITGYVPDDDLPEALAAVDVPVCFHQHFSASGSINTWIAAGRRPLVPRVRYTEEMAALRPGTLTLVDSQERPQAVERALGDPDSTWLPPGPSLHTMADVAAAYRHLLGGAP